MTAFLRWVWTTLLNAYVLAAGAAALFLVSAIIVHLLKRLVFGASL